MGDRMGFAGGTWWLIALLLVMNALPLSAQTLQVSILTKPEERIDPPLVQVWQHREGSSAVLLTSQVTFALMLDALAEEQRYLVSVTSDDVTFFSPLIDFTLHPTYHYMPLIRPALVATELPPVELTLSHGDEYLILSYAIGNTSFDQPLRLTAPLHIPLPAEFSLTTPIDGVIAQGILSLRSVAPSGTTLTMIIPELGRHRIPLPDGAVVKTVGTLNYQVHVTPQGVLELQVRQPGFLFVLGGLGVFLMATLLWRSKWRWWVIRRVKRLSLLG